MGRLRLLFEEFRKERRHRRAVQSQRDLEKYAEESEKYYKEEKKKKGAGL